MAKKPAAKAKPIIDVAHPNRTPPPRNSKSIIVNNRPLLKDPMMADTNASEPPAETAAKPPSAKTGSESRVAPLTAPVLAAEGSADTETPKTEPAKPPEAEEAAAKTGTASEPKSTTIAPAEPEKPPAVEPEKPALARPEKLVVEPDHPDKNAEPADDEVQPDQEPAPTKDADAQAAAEEAKRDAAVQQLADSKQYYLPINTVEKRRSRRFVILGIIVSLVLIVAWADIALDAGLIHLGGIKPVTHFFSN